MRLGSMCCVISVWRMLPLFISDNVHSSLQTHICPLKGLAQSKTKHVCTSLVRFVWQLIPFIPETFGVGVVAMFGAGVAVVRVALKVEQEIS